MAQSLTIGSDWNRFACLFNDVYCPVKNPNGIISLGVAENFLSPSISFLHVHCQTHMS